TICHYNISITRGGQNVSRKKKKAGRLPRPALSYRGLRSLFHCLVCRGGCTGGLQLLLEAAAGLEAGDRGGLQPAGHLGLGVGVGLGLAGTHLETAETGDGHLLVGPQALGDLVKHSVHRRLHLALGEAGLAGDSLDHLGTGHVTISSWNSFSVQNSPCLWRSSKKLVKVTYFCKIFVVE